MIFIIPLKNTAFEPFFVAKYWEERFMSRNFFYIIGDLMYINTSPAKVESIVDYELYSFFF